MNPSSGIKGKNLEQDWDTLLSLAKQHGWTKHEKGDQVLEKGGSKIPTEMKGCNFSTKAHVLSQQRVSAGKGT